MNAFEDLIALLLRRKGYWTSTALKVVLTKEEKREIGTHSAPRWEIDVVAYKGATNEVLAVECKSFLDSTGVVFRQGAFEPPDTYKLFSREKTRTVVMNAMIRQLQSCGACGPDPVLRIALATGHIARKTDRDQMKAHFDGQGWLLFDDEWVRNQLSATAEADYENEAAIVVAKLLLRGGPSSTRASSSDSGISS
ncbi:MAG: hypothetical protein IPJ77_19050 [Planctomycetes bacterium]|nr:hypothetical protein [Planctomycetota bacterium]